ncbi:hypothetical protein ACFSTC_04060 [Nonomuraea ferruginea]
MVAELGAWWCSAGSSSSWGACAVLTGATVLVLGLMGLGLGCLITAVVLAVEHLPRQWHPQNDPDAGEVRRGAGPLP